MSGLGPSDPVGERQGRGGSIQALGTAVEGGVQVLRWKTRPAPIPPFVGVETVSRAYSKRFNFSPLWRLEVQDHVVLEPCTKSQH